MTLGLPTCRLGSIYLPKERVRNKVGPTFKSILVVAFIYLISKLFTYKLYYLQILQIIDE